MNKFLLDTNIVVGALKGHSTIRDFFLAELLDKPRFLSEINRMELLGYHNITVEEETAIYTFLVFVDILPIDRRIANRVIQLRRQANRLKLPDAIIAATAMEHRLILVSCDEIFTKVALPELTVLNPSRI